MEIISVSERRSGDVVHARVEDVTYVELLLLSGLNGALLGEALDDSDGFVELGLGHGGGVWASGSGGLERTHAGLAGETDGVRAITISAGRTQSPPQAGWRTTPAKRPWVALG